MVTQTFLHDSLVKLVSGFHPFGTIGTGETSLFGEAETAVKGNPEHNLRVGEVLLVVSDFPDGHVGFYYRDTVSRMNLSSTLKILPSTIVKT